MRTAPTTLEALVTRYRREALRAAEGGAAPELEVRFHGVDFAAFAAVYRALQAGAAGAGPGELSQTVSVLAGGRPPRGEGGSAPQPTRIRVIEFADGARRGERRERKTPLLPPYRAAGGARALPFIVALSEEAPDDRPFTADEASVLRVKARVGFPFALPAAGEADAPAHQWRADLTATRQLAGGDATARGVLPAIVAAMFPRGATAATLLAALGLADDAAPAPRALYTYEVEAEYLGPPARRDALRPADVLAAAEALQRLVSPGHAAEAALQAEVGRLARHVVRAAGYRRRFERELGLKRLLPQVRALSRGSYGALYPPTGLYLTDKADGRRAVAVARGGRGLVLADALFEFAPAGAGAAPAADARDEAVADGELVGTPPDARFYAFDALVAGGAELGELPFEARLARLPEAVAALVAAGVPAEAKPYRRLAGATAAALRAEVLAVHGAARPYAIDGLIFVRPGAAYDATEAHKWKPAEHNTIDFLARRAPPSALGAAPFADRPGAALHFLFVGATPALYAALGLELCPGYAELFGGAGRGSFCGAPAPAGAPGRGPPAPGAAAEAYFPVPFAPSDAPLAYLYWHPADSPLGDVDCRVVEARCAGGCLAAGGGAATAAWALARVRDDRRADLQAGRYYGNDFRTAELVWTNYLAPLPLEALWEGAGGYFQEGARGAYRAQRAVVSFVKGRHIAALAHAARVVDLACGQGQDLKRYLDAGVRRLLAVDRDRAALAELVHRKYDMSRGGRAPPRAGRFAQARGGATTVHTLLADLAAPHAETLARFEAAGFPRGGADAAVCNLAAHYFCASVEGVRNFAALAAGAVRAGGHVVLSFFRGEAVHARLRAAGVAAGGTWEARDAVAGPPKYAIRRLYAGGALEAAGQTIGVRLPFSAGEFYEEALVNTAALAAELGKRGCRLVSDEPMTAALPEFEARRPDLSALLTAADRDYLGLYCTMVFVREP